MARRKYNKSRRRRRRRSRRSMAVKYQNQKIPRLALFGNSRSARFKYTFVGQIVLGVGIPLPLSFRANSPWDPFVGLGAGSARGWQQVSPLFDRYTVLGSKATVTFLHNQLSIVGHPVVNYIELSTDPTTALLDPRDAIESRHVSYASWAPGQGARGCKLSRTFSARNFYTKADVLDCVELGADMDQNPAEQAFYNISFSPTHAAEVTPCDVIVEISYFVVLSDPVNPPAS